MRRNKPRQRGVREARPAGGAGLGGRPGGRGARCSGAGEGGETPVTSRCPRPGRQLCTRTFPRPQLFYLPTDPPGEYFYLPPRSLFLGSHRVPGGEAQFRET